MIRWTSKVLSSKLAYFSHFSHLIELSDYAHEKLKTKSESFDPLLFLTEIHYDTNYESLCEGIKNLKETIDTRTETLRELVKENFNKFVTARNTARTIEEIISTKNPSQQLNALQQGIQQVLQEITQLANPLVDSKNVQEEILKKLELIHEFEPFLSANVKIKQLFYMKKYQELSLCYSSAKSLYLSIKQTKMIQKIWSTVEQTIDTVRNTLLTELKGMSILSTNDEIQRTLL